MLPVNWVPYFTLGMESRPTNMRPSEPSQSMEGARRPLYERSAFWRFFVDAGFAWDMMAVVVAALAGVGALLYAIFNLSVLALALALVALPLAFILWCIAKGVRDVGRDS